MHLLRRVVVFVTLASLFIPTAHAVTPEKGLLIAPTQQFLYVDAGKSLQSSFTVTNLTDQPLPLSFSIKQFSVADYSYTYEFTPPPNDWLTLDTTATMLPAKQAMKVAYTITVPSRAAPGGRYYTLLASATTSDGGVSSTIQAADLLYLTVNGQLLTSSVLKSGSIQRFAWGNAFTFKLAPENIGNVYTNVQVHGRLVGLLTKPEQKGDAHILIPDKPRTLTGAIPTPLLPGVYRAEYGYTTSGDWNILEHAWVVFVPPWFLSLLLVIAILLPRLLSKKKKVGELKSPKPS